MAKIPDSTEGDDSFDPRALFRMMERGMMPDTEDDAYAAQQLFYDAMDASSYEEEMDLLRKSLELDPSNVDSLLVMLARCGLDGHGEIEGLKKIVALAAERLGEENFKQFEGHFWGFHETRPYMRARQMLAEAHHALGQKAEAIAEWEGMHRLNPGDNQGIRYRLLPAYLESGDLEKAKQLLAKSDETDFSTTFAWCDVLFHFLSNDLDAAEQALSVARKQNRHTETYLMGKKKTPKTLPNGYSPGSKEEAVCFAEDLIRAWRPHSEACRWRSRMIKKR